MASFADYGCSLCDYTGNAEDIFSHLEEEHNIAITPVSYIEGGEDFTLEFHLEDGTVIYSTIDIEWLREQLEIEINRQSAANDNV